MQRLVSIDIAKGICIILVVIGHYIPENSPEWYLFLNHFIYSFHMPLFMFASGYVYMSTKKKEKYGHFIWKKTKRLVIPYLSISVVIISIKLFSQNGMYIENPVTVSSYLRMFYLPEAGYFLWFVWALWEMFLIVPIFDTPQKRLILFLVSLCLGLMPIHIDFFSINEFAIMLKYFMLGVVLCEHPTYLKRAKEISATLTAVIFITIFTWSQIVPHIYPFDLIYNILPYLGIYMICLISRKIHTCHRLLTQCLLIVSASSYTIYLFHTTFEGLMKAILYKTPLFNNDINPYAFSLGAIIVISMGVLIPIMLQRYILTKNRTLGVLFGVFQK